MPLYRWKCPGTKSSADSGQQACGYACRSLKPDAPSCGNLWCDNYGKVLIRDTAGSTSVMENRDNGAMVRKLERYVNAEDLVKSHADSSKPPNDGIV